MLMLMIVLINIIHITEGATNQYLGDRDESETVINRRICAICCQYVDKDYNKWEQCGHAFHHSCTKTWVEKKKRTCPCPLCKIEQCANLYTSSDCEQVSGCVWDYANGTCDEEEKERKDNYVVFFKQFARTLDKFQTFTWLLWTVLAPSYPTMFGWITLQFFYVYWVYLFQITIGSYLAFFHRSCAISFLTLIMFLLLHSFCNIYGILNAELPNDHYDSATKTFEMNKRIFWLVLYQVFNVIFYRYFSD